MLCWTVHLKGGPMRFNHAAVAVGHRVYSFGGCNSNGNSMSYMAQIDVHIFNTVSLQWTKLPSAPAAGRGAPEPVWRWRHTAVLIDDAVYIWGGITYSRTSNVLYTFNVNTHGWSMPRISGTTPEERSGHSACALGKVMYVFGGHNTLTGHSNDIYKLDTGTMVWSFLSAGGTPPPARLYHSATIIGTRMFVFGGRGDEEHYDKVRVFDTETNTWLNTPHAQVFPAHKGHAAFAYKGELYVFGGHHLCRFFNYLWKFNPATFRWTKVEPKGKGPSAWMSRMCCCMVGELIVIFGGYDTDDDLYILDLRPTLATLCKLSVIQYDLEKSDLPRHIRWELADMTKTA